MPKRKIKTRPVSPARAVFAAALAHARDRQLSTWESFAPTYVDAMQRFDELVARGEVSSGDLRNGKGDAFNDFLVTLLQNCSGKELNTRPDVPGLSFPVHKLDIAYPDVPRPVELAIETKATGVPLHPGNETSQKHQEGRAGKADLEKRVKEASLKNIDIKAEAARSEGKGGGPTSDLGSWMRSAKPRCYLLLAVRVRDEADLVKTIALAHTASTWFDRCGLFCFGWNAAHTGYESKPVPPNLELDRVLAEVCSALRNLP